MNEYDSRFHIEKPKWILFDSAWWFTIWGGIAALITFWYPNLSSASTLLRIFLSCLAFVLSPILVALLLYLYRVTRFLGRRMSVYQELYGEWLGTKVRLHKANETILSLRKALGNRQLLEIERIQYYRNRVYAVIRQDKTVAVERGELVLIIDSSDGLTLGNFRIQDIRNEEYVAAQDGYIDPLWLGYLKSTGESEMRPPPGSIAVLATEATTDNV